MEYQIITTNFVALVRVNDDTIIETAPILRKFTGQPLSNLKKWVEKKFPNEWRIVELNQ